MSNSIVTTQNYEILAPNGQPLATGYAEKPAAFSKFVLLGFFVLISFFGGSIYWSLNANLNGAVVAPASFVVKGNKKTVQHLDGGIVSELLVTEGDYVEANQVLIRMDSTDNDVNIDVLGSQYTELSIRKARLIAELDEKSNFELIDVKVAFSESVQKADIQNTFFTQKKLFDAQQKSRQSEEEILQQRIASLDEEIKGIKEQRASNSRQTELAKAELVTFETLFAKGLTQKSRVNSVKRELERLRGLDASFITSRARALNQIGELKLTGLGQQKLRKESVTTELAAIEAQIASIEPQYMGALQKQSRVEITAPVSGKVVNMSIYTKGGVIRPGEPIMDVVPLGEELIVEAKINVTDIDKLRIGQASRIHLSGFDQTDIPEATGMIIDISADSIQDERSGEDYFVARIKLDEEQAANVASLEIVPGMPADVFVNTGERTAISYLMQPLNERISRTFIE